MRADAIFLLLGMKNKNFWRKRPANKQPFLFNWAIAIHNTPIKAKLSYTPPAVIEQRAQGAKILLLCGSSQFAALWLAAQATTTHSALGPMQWAFVFTGNSTVPTEVAVLAAFSRSSVPPPPFLSLSFYWSWSGRRANAAALLPPPRRLCQRWA